MLIYGRELFSDFSSFAFDGKMYAGVAIRMLWCSATFAAMVIQHCKCSVIPNPSAQLQNLQLNTAAEEGKYNYITSEHYY